MRSAIGGGILLALTFSHPQQPDTEYRIGARFLAGNPQESRPLRVLDESMLTVRPTAIAAYSFAGDYFRVAITASELIPGRIALHVKFETLTGSSVRASVFDLVTGADFSAPTVALRDAAGGFLMDKQGLPLFFEVTTVRRESRSRDVRPNNPYLQPASGGW